MGFILVKKYIMNPKNNVNRIKKSTQKVDFFYYLI